MLDLLPHDVMLHHIAPLLSLHDMRSLNQTCRQLHNTISSMRALEWAWHFKSFYPEQEQPAATGHSMDSQNLHDLMTLLLTGEIQLPWAESSASGKLAWFSRHFLGGQFVEDARSLMLAAALGDHTHVEQCLAHMSTPFLKSCEWQARPISLRWASQQVQAHFTVMDTAGRVACRYGREQCAMLLMEQCMKYDPFRADTNNTLNWFFSACRSDSLSVAQTVQTKLGLRADVIEQRLRRHFSMGFTSYWIQYTSCQTKPFTRSVEVMDYLLHCINLIASDDCRRGLLLDAVLDPHPAAPNMAAHIMRAFQTAEQYAPAGGLRRQRSNDAIFGRGLLGFPGQERRASHDTRQGMSEDEVQEYLAHTIFPPLPAHGMGQLLTCLVRAGDDDLISTFHEVYGHSLSYLFQLTVRERWTEARELAESLGHVEIADFITTCPLRRDSLSPAEIARAKLMCETPVEDPQRAMPPNHEVAVHMPRHHPFVAQSPVRQRRVSPPRARRQSAPSAVEVVVPRRRLSLDWSPRNLLRFAWGRRRRSAGLHAPNHDHEEQALDSDMDTDEEDPEEDPSEERRSAALQQLRAEVAAMPLPSTPERHPVSAASSSGTSRRLSLV